MCIDEKMDKWMMRRMGTLVCGWMDEWMGYGIDCDARVHIWIGVWFIQYVLMKKWIKKNGKQINSM